MSLTPTVYQSHMLLSPTVYQSYMLLSPTVYQSHMLLTPTVYQSYMLLTPTVYQSYMLSLLYQAVVVALFQMDGLEGNPIGKLVVNWDSLEGKTVLEWVLWEGWGFETIKLRWVETCVVTWRNTSRAIWHGGVWDGQNYSAEFCLQLAADNSANRQRKFILMKHAL